MRDWKWTAAAAALAHERLEPAELGRAVEHRDRHGLRRVVCGDLEAAHVRRKKEQRLALRARRVHRLQALHFTHQRGDLVLRAQPHRRRLDQRLAGMRDRGTAYARVA